LLQELIHWDLLSLFVELVVDLFPGLATILIVLADLNFSDLLANALVYQDLIDCEVLCDVAELAITRSYATKVIKDRVTDLVSKQEL